MIVNIKPRAANKIAAALYLIGSSLWLASQCESDYNCKPNRESFAISASIIGSLAWSFKEFSPLEPECANQFISLTFSLCYGAHLTTLPLDESITNSTAQLLVNSFNLIQESRPKEKKIPVSDAIISGISAFFYSLATLLTFMNKTESLEQKLTTFVFSWGTIAKLYAASSQPDKNTTKSGSTREVNIEIKKPTTPITIILSFRDKSPITIKVMVVTADV